MRVRTKDRGRDVLSRKWIRAQLTALNDALDGPEGVAVMRFRSGEVGVSCVSNFYDQSDAGAFVVESVVVLPGDGKPFPLVAFTEALLVSRVLDEDK